MKDRTVGWKSKLLAKPRGPTFETRFMEAELNLCWTQVARMGHSGIEDESQDR